MRKKEKNLTCAEFVSDVESLRCAKMQAIIDEEDPIDFSIDYTHPFSVAGLEALYKIIPAIPLQQQENVVAEIVERYVEFASVSNLRLELKAEFDIWSDFALIQGWYRLPTADMVEALLRHGVLVLLAMSDRDLIAALSSSICVILLPSGGVIVERLKPPIPP